jgi:hypothetical protein
MKKHFVLWLFLSLIMIRANSQEQQNVQKGYWFNQNFDVALSANAKQSAVALSWVKFHQVTRKSKFLIGYGVRLTSQFGNNLDYATAPAILTSKQRGPQVLFSPIFYENVDTFSVPSTRFNTLNASINLQYTFRQKLDIGFNIDAVGFSFGKKIKGTYHSYEDQGTSVEQGARPTAFNLLLVSDNDIGSLNSELYVRYWFKQKWAVRIGATFMFTEYTTDNKLYLDNDRWRNKALMAMIGITYSPFK